MSGLLEYPQYTRPAIWHGQKVPEVLVSGHQANIERWQHLAALRETLRRRPDLFQKQHMSAGEWLELLDLSDFL
jgi:tRNA (guanine37-N1)-methyltransferase